MDAHAFNDPKTSNSFVNKRGISLHFRYNLVCDPEGKPSSAMKLLFFLHGYGGHINGPTYRKMTSFMNSKNVAVFSIEFEGHGHSQGERALIYSHEDLMEDFLHFVSLILVEDITNSDIINLDKSSDRLEILKLRSIPFAVMGQSMGGAVATLVSNSLMSFPMFKGAILLAPALSFSTISPWIVEILRYTVGTFSPVSQMPPWLNKTTDNTASVKGEDVLLRAQLDTWGLPGALGWNQSMRWATALMFIDMNNYIQQNNILSSAQFPFLIIHDPQDRITNISGSKELYQRSQTPLENKRLIEVCILLLLIVVENHLFQRFRVTCTQY